MLPLNVLILQALFRLVHGSCDTSESGIGFFWPKLSRTKEGDLTSSTFRPERYLLVLCFLCLQCVQDDDDGDHHPRIRLCKATCKATRCNNKDKLCCRRNCAILSTDQVPVVAPMTIIAKERLCNRLPPLVISKLATKSSAKSSLI